jgi:hypothetical protein
MRECGKVKKSFVCDKSIGTDSFLAGVFKIFRVCNKSSMAPERKKTQTKIAAEVAVATIE